MSITMFSVGKTSFEMYFQTITNESGVRSVCYDASIQPYPLVLVLWLYTYTVNLHYNTIVTHLERPENKKCPNFCKTAATQCPKKRCTKGSVHEKKTPQRKGPNAELRNLPCIIVTLGTLPFGASLFWTLGGFCLAEIWRFFVFRTFQMFYKGIVMKVLMYSHSSSTNGYG